MDFLWRGIQAGLLLALLVGPLIFALLQASLEHGIRGGTMVGLGIWVSDLLFIMGVYAGLQYIQQITEWPYFKPTLGIGGSIILIFFGLGMLLNQSIPVENTSSMASRTYWQLWLKGFLINTINPFTIIFWLGLIGAMFVQEGATDRQMYWFLGGILGTIVVTDFTKVSLAKYIRRWLSPNHIRLMRRISGSIFLIFGLLLLVRVFLLPGFSNPIF